MRSYENLFRLTNGPKHHFFGFHDLEISSRKSGFVLTLAVDCINRPPIEGEEAIVRVINPNELGELIDITKTQTYNFPQGARQQWLSDSNQFIVNQKEENRVVSGIYDIDTKKKISQLDQSTHILNKTAEVSYSIDFGRLHRLGGYGYAGINDQQPDEAAPAQNGIFATEIATNKSELILSIYDVVNADGKAKKSHSHHFFTHLSLNPSGDRLAFLHRYRLPDGGEETCLMTVGVDGKDCRLLSRGFLSHFDWKNDKQIMIWGRKNNAVSHIRNNPLLKNLFVRKTFGSLKNIVRPFIANSSMMTCSFLLVDDAPESDVKEIAKGVLLTDGHPMVNPRNREWLIVDTYPNDHGVRDLMLYRFSDEKTVDLGQYRMLDKKPSPEIIDEVSKYMKKKIHVSFSPEQYAFTRSGLHCDLHPRWFSNGNFVAFDSIHEGSRQIYAMDVSAELVA